MVSKHLSRGVEEIILTLEGPLRRVHIPDWHQRAYWSTQYQTPEGRVVTGTIARAMRWEYAKAIMYDIRRQEE